MSIVSRTGQAESQSPWAKLPIELWGVVASFAQPSSLRALSLTSKDHREFALKARVQNVFHQKLQEFQQAISLEVRPLASTPSHLNTYFHIIHLLHENNLFPENCEEKRLLQKKLALRLTSPVGHEALVRKSQLNKLIRKNLLSWKEIDQFGALFQMKYLIGSLVFLTHSSLDKKRIIELIIFGSVRQGDHLLFKQLIGNKTFNEPFRGHILKVASAKGHIEIVKIILEMGSVSVQDLKISLKHGLVLERLDFVQILTPLVNLDQHERSIMILYAIKNRAFDISQYLGYNNLTLQMRAIALDYALKGGDLDLVKTILESGDIEVTARGLAVRYAASIGRLDMIRLILAKGNIDPLHRQQAAALLKTYLPS